MLLTAGILRSMKACLIIIIIKTFLSQEANQVRVFAVSTILVVSLLLDDALTTVWYCGHHACNIITSNCAGIGEHRKLCASALTLYHHE